MEFIDIMHFMSVITFHMLFVIMLFVINTIITFVYIDRKFIKSEK